MINWLNVDLIREELKRNLLTVKELSEKSGVSEKTILRFKCGTTKCLRLDNLCKVSKALGLTYKDIRLGKKS